MPLKIINGRKKFLSQPSDLNQLFHLSGKKIRIQRHYTTNYHFDIPGNIFVTLKLFYSNPASL
jgi:hypothetical protein